jgi:hypothetical protein
VGEPTHSEGSGPSIGFGIREKALKRCFSPEMRRMKSPGHELAEGAWPSFGHHDVQTTSEDDPEGLSGSQKT